MKPNHAGAPDDATVRFEKQEDCGECGGSGMVMGFSGPDDCRYVDAHMELAAREARAPVPGLYGYWTIRYVPDTVRGEYVNVGLIVGKGGDWAMRRVQNFDRASLLGGDARRTVPWFNRTQEIVEGGISVGPIQGWLDRQNTMLNNTIQLTESVVAAESAADGLRLLYDLLVTE